MTTRSDLALRGFVLARLAEQEQALLACQNWSECDPSYGCPAHPSEGHRMNELGAMRRIVEAWVAADKAAGPYPGTEAGVEQGLASAVLELALAYADHPDFEAGWL